MKNNKKKNQKEKESQAEKLRALEAVKKPTKNMFQLHSREHILHLIGKYEEYEPDVTSEFQKYKDIDSDFEDFKITKACVFNRMNALQETHDTLSKLIREYNTEHPSEKPIMFKRDTVRDKEATVPSDTSSGSTSE